MAAMKVAPTAVRKAVMSVAQTVDLKVAHWAALLVV